MARSGNIEKLIVSRGAGGYYMGVDWKINSQSKDNRTSNITASVYIRSSGKDYKIVSSVSKKIGLTINGQTYSGTNTIGIGYNVKKVLLTKTVDVQHDSDGRKTCSFGCSVEIGFVLSGTKFGTVSTSGSGVLDPITVSSPPYFGSGACISIRENGASGRVISNASGGTEDLNKFPENVSKLYISWPAAQDKDTTSGMKYVLKEQIDNGSFTEIYTGAANNYTVNIGAGNGGRSYDYKVHAVDNTNLSSSSIEALQVQKNTFTHAKLTLGGITSIGSSSSNQTITIQKAGASNTYTSGSVLNYTLSAKIGGRDVKVYNPTASGNLTIIPNSSPISGPYIILQDIRNIVADSLYNGTLTITLTTENGWGSKGTSSQDIRVDLRNTPIKGGTPVVIDSSSYYNIGGSNYIVPDRKRIRLSWGRAIDANGIPITYRVEQNIDSSGWTTLINTTSDTFYEFSTAVSGKPTYTWRVYAKNGYGNEILLSGSPSAVLYSYKPPEISISSTSRTTNSIAIKYQIALSTDIPNNSLKKVSISYKGRETALSTSTSGTANLNNIGEDSDGLFTITAIDTLGVNFGASAGSTIEGSVPQFYPVLSVRKNGVGIKSIPNGDADFVVGGTMKVQEVNVTGRLVVNGKEITGNPTGGGTTGNYLPISGGTITGDLKVNRALTVSGTSTLSSLSASNATISSDVRINGKLYVGGKEITGSSSSGGGGSSQSSITFNQIYPIGSIFMSVNSTNPGNLFSGTVWEAWGQGRVPVGVDGNDGTFQRAESKGGAKTHTLSTNEMPSHTHTQNAHNHTQQPHTHTQAPHTHTVKYRGFNISASKSGSFVLRRNDPGDGFDGTDADASMSTTAINNSTTAQNNSTTATNNNTGGGAAHNNLQPYITCYMWKRIR